MFTFSIDAARKPRLRQERREIEIRLEPEMQSQRRDRALELSTEWGYR